MNTTPNKPKRKRLLWIILGSVAGLFILLMTVGVIGVATQPGGWDAAMAEQAASQAAEDEREDEEERAAEASAAADAKARADAEAKAEQEAKDAEAAKTPEDRVVESVGADGLKVSTSSGAVLATFDLADNLTDGMMATGAQMDTMEILKAVKEHIGDYERVFVQGSFPMTDQFGNTEDSVILDLLYVKTTVDKINFDGIDPDAIWEIRDGGEVHPELTE